jgi:hypothetical protein
MAIAAALLAGCAARPKPAPSPAPVARPAPAPPVAEAPAGAPADWPDRPLSPGDWTYAGHPGGSEARYGAALRLRCDSGRRSLTILRAGAGGALRVRTTYGERSIAAGAALAAGDPLLDEMAFSRGRFAVEADGLEPLIVPAWAEPARVVEDCRG